MYIRQATIGDASFLAQIILIAGRAHVNKGIWEIVLGGTEEECLSFLQHITITDTPHLFHYSKYLIAEEDGFGSIGSLGGYTPNIFGYQALQQAIPEVVPKLGLTEKFAWESQTRSARIMACLPKEIEGAWVIDSVATLPEHRGKGCAESLLHTMLEKGRSQGHSRAQVNMYIGNEPALKLYQKLDFKIVEEVRDPYFEANIGSPGMISLVKAL